RGVQRPYRTRCAARQRYVPRTRRNSLVDHPPQRRGDTASTENSPAPIPAGKPSTRGENTISPCHCHSGPREHRDRPAHAEKLIAVYWLGRRPAHSGTVDESRIRRPSRPLDHSNRLVTEPSLNTSLIARASSGAIDSWVSLSNCRSFDTGSELVMTTSEIRESLSRSTAGPDSTPCVATAITLAAPCSNKASAAFTMVPAVSIMSSTRTQVRPRTSPTTSWPRTSCATSGSRRLWTIASGVPSRSAHRSAVRTRPESGDTTVVLLRSTLAAT